MQITGPSASAAVPARRSAAEDRARWLNFDGRNRQMAQKRWQWLGFVGTGQHFSFLILIGLFATLEV
jgi:hypothetical protein